MLLFIFVFLSIGIFNRAIFKKYYCNKALFLGAEVNTLMVGDSHTMSSLNPEFVHNSANISLAQENYYLLFYKIKIFLLNNSQLKNIIIGFSNHNISNSYFESTIYEKDRTKEVLDMYYPLMDHEGRKIIRAINAPYIENYMKYNLGIPIKIYKDNLYIKNIFDIEITKEDYVFFGNYYDSNKNNLDQEKTRITSLTHYYSDGKYSGKSTISINYLIKIIEICRNNGKNVYLYKSPLHTIYKNKIPSSSINDYNALVGQLMNRYKDIVFIDYSDIQLPNNYYGDGNHVNSSGAKIISLRINKILDNATNNKNRVYNEKAL